MAVSNVFAAVVAAAALYVMYVQFSGLSQEDLVKRITGNRVVVTGASLGIGREIVKEYAHLGAADIVIVARSEDKLVSLRDEVYASFDSQHRLNKPRIHVIPADLSSEEACQEVVDKATAAMGGMDYLVLNHITNSQYGLWTGKLLVCFKLSTTMGCVAYLQ
jgi:enoyl-[acyl-carrier-protein] reductase (NADH)